MTPLELTLGIILGVVALISGIVTIFTRRRNEIDEIEKDHNTELRGLAETRKSVIDELRNEMRLMQTAHASEIARLESEIAELRGQYTAMRNFQANEIVQNVVKGVLNGLGALD